MSMWTWYWEVRKCSFLPDLIQISPNFYNFRDSWAYFNSEIKFKLSHLPFRKIKWWPRAKLRNLPLYSFRITIQVNTVASHTHTHTPTHSLIVTWYDILHTFSSRTLTVLCNHINYAKTKNRSSNHGCYNEPTHNGRNILYRTLYSKHGMGLISGRDDLSAHMYAKVWKPIKVLGHNNSSTLDRLTNSGVWNLFRSDMTCCSMFMMWECEGAVAPRDGCGARWTLISFRLSAHIRRCQVVLYCHKIWKYAATYYHDTIVLNCHMGLKNSWNVTEELRAFCWVCQRCFLHLVTVVNKLA